MPSTFFVRTGGSDSADGLTDATAWASVAKINGRTFLPDDQILFRRGDTWRETLIVPAGGTTGHPVTYGAYGTGGSPVFTGADTISGFLNGGANLWDKAGFTVAPLLVMVAGLAPKMMAAARVACTTPGSWFYAAGTLTVYATSDPSGTVEAGQRDYCVKVVGKLNVTLANLSVRMAQQWGFRTGDADVSGLLMDGVLAEYCYRAGWTANWQGSTTITGLVCKNSTFRYNCGSGAEHSVLKFTGWLFDNIDCYGNAQWTDNANSSHTFACGLKLFSANALGGVGTVVKNSRFYQNGIPSGSHDQGHGLWFDTASGIRAVGNACWGNNGAGIYLEKTFDCVADHNLSFNNCLATNPGSGSANILLQVGQGLSAARNLVYHNTCVGGTWGIAVWSMNPGTACTISQNVIRNNLVLGASVANLMAKNGGDNNGVDGTGNVYDHNGFGPAGPTLAIWGASTKTTYAALDAAYGAPMGNVPGDPQFLTPGAFDFHLRATSPARDAGAVLPGINDTYTGPAPDLGAYEFMPTPTDPPVNVGSYTVVATITDPNYQGSATGTEVISKSAAQVTLSGLAQTYDGTPKPVTVTTVPPGLAVTVTYAAA